MKPKPEIPRSYAHLLAGVIEPIVEWVHAEHGRKALFVRKMKDADPTLRRSTVEPWLHPDPKTRTQPMLGYGLLAQDVAKKLGIYRQARTKPTAPTPEQ